MGLLARLCVFYMELYVSYPSEMRWQTPAEVNDDGETGR